MRQWTDTIPFRYEYTAGVAGERFLRGLIEGRILGGYCPTCGETSLPLRIYCPSCYGRIAKAVRVGPAGRVRSVTTGADGSRYAFVTFKGVRGGIVHRLLGKSRAGGEVVAKFKPRKERTGSIDDIQGFGSKS